MRCPSLHLVLEAVKEVSPFCSSSPECCLLILPFCVFLEDTSLNKTLMTNPGPGTYTDRESSRYKRGCSMSIGKRPEAVHPELRKVPGPGSYN